MSNFHISPKDPIDALIRKFKESSVFHFVKGSI